MLFVPDDWGKIPVAAWILYSLLNLSRIAGDATTTAGLAGSVVGTLVGGFLLVAIVRYVYLYAAKTVGSDGESSPE